jgi:hypothetical protein
MTIYSLSYGDTVTRTRMNEVIIFRASEKDAELIRAAAAPKEIAQADFIRLALKERAARVLTGSDDRGSE